MAARLQGDAAHQRSTRRIRVDLGVGTRQGRSRQKQRLELNELVSMAPDITEKNAVSNGNQNERQKRPGKGQNRKRSSPQGRERSRGSRRRTEVSELQRRAAAGSGEEGLNYSVS
jgi:hypothetical protein